MSRTERIEYRIESKRPGRRTWEWIPATGFMERDLETLRARIERAHEQASQPGWKYRIASRTVITETSPWEPLEEEM